VELCFIPVMMFAAGIAALITLVAVAAALGGTRLGSRRYGSPREAGLDLERLCGLEAAIPEDSWFQSLEAVTLSGEMPSGRWATVDFQIVPHGKTRITYTRFRVAAPKAPWLSIRREGLLDKVGKWIGGTRDLEVGDRDFDDRFLIQTKSDDKALVAFARGLKGAVLRAFEVHSIDSLVADDGWLLATVRTSTINPADYPRLLDVLDRAAQSFERVSIRVRVLDLERRAFVAEGRTRCAYCHGGITGDEPDLVACPRCHTVLHDGCWSENRHCPVLGCAETTPERPRVT
jgi:hypothetical protein